jgi:hypothetical protein
LSWQVHLNQNLRSRVLKQQIAISSLSQSGGLATVECRQLRPVTIHPIPTLRHGDYPTVEIDLSSTVVRVNACVAPDLVVESWHWMNSPAVTEATKPDTVIRSRWPLTSTRKIQKPDASLWSVTPLNRAREAFGIIRRS